MQEGFTALHRSCVTGNAAVVQFLVDNKADVNVEDTVSRTRCLA